MAKRLATALTAYSKNPATLAAGALAALKPKTPKAPVASTAAPSTVPRVPATPTPTPLPWDANYESTVSGINRNRDAGLADLTNQEAGVKQQYGFDDASNPFSRLKMLESAFANRKQGTTNGMAAAGQLYSGALLNQQADDQHGHDSDYDTLRRGYQSDLDALASRRTALTNQAADDTSAADWERTQTALANRPDPATTPALASAGAAVTAKPKDYTVRQGKGGVWHDYKDGRKPVFVKG